MSDDDVKQQALEQAQQAYGLFIWFVKWFSYVMIFMITLMFMNNWFDEHVIIDFGDFNNKEDKKKADDLKQKLKEKLEEEFKDDETS